MRWLLLAAAILLGGHDAPAQQLPAPEQKVALSLTVEQVKLIAEALPMIGCQNVAALIKCQMAIDLLREIQRQAREQVK